jgi:hypothetical protein
MVAATALSRRWPAETGNGVRGFGVSIFWKRGVDFAASSSITGVKQVNNNFDFNQ